MRQFSLTTTLAAGAFALSVIAPAQAITVTTVIQNLAYVPATGGYQAPASITGTVDHVIPPPGSLASVYRSPWETPTDVHIEPQWSAQEYTSVRNGSALYNFSGTALDIFWGSPDTYNSITFYTSEDGGGASFTFGGAALLFPTYGHGHDQVRLITDVPFLSIRLSSTNPAFEFTNLSPCGLETDCGPPLGTPLPAALPLFASALGLGGLLSWRKRRRTKAAAVAMPA